MGLRCFAFAKRIRRLTEFVVGLSTGSAHASSAANVVVIGSVDFGLTAQAAGTLNTVRGEPALWMHVLSLQNCQTQHNKIKERKNKKETQEEKKNTHEKINTQKIKFEKYQNRENRAKQTKEQNIYYIYQIRVWYIYQVNCKNSTIYHIRVWYIFIKCIFFKFFPKCQSKENIYNKYISSIFICIIHNWDMMKKHKKF